MSVVPIFRLAASLHLASSTVEITDLFGHALPVCGSRAADLAVMFVAAFLIHEVGDQSRPLRAWLRRIWNTHRDRHNGPDRKGPVIGNGQ